MNTQIQDSKLKLYVVFKPEYRKITPDGEERNGFFYMGQWLLKYWYQQYHLPMDNELVAVIKKLQQLKGRIEKVVIYDRRNEAPSPVIYEWYRGNLISDGLKGKINPKMFE